MAFSVKDWRNANAVGGGGDTSTPLDAAALEDMETRLSGYTDTSLFPAAILFVDYTNGNDSNSGRWPGTGGALKTLAAAETALPATRGGAIYLAGGVHDMAGVVTLDKCRRLIGVGSGVSAGGSGTQLRAAAGTGGLLLDSSQKIEVRALTVLGQSVAGATGTGTVTSGSASVTSVSTTTGTFAIGQKIAGRGIPGEATITNFAAGTITLSVNAVESGTAVAITGSTTDVGIDVRSHGTILDDVLVKNFGSHGVYVNSAADNANGCDFRSVRSEENWAGNGFFLKGNDSNACTLYVCDASGNGGWGYENRNNSNLFMLPQCENNKAGAIRDAGNSNLWLLPYIEGPSSVGQNVDLASSADTDFWGQAFGTPTLAPVPATSVRIVNELLKVADYGRSADVQTLDRSLARTDTANLTSGTVYAARAVVMRTASYSQIRFYTGASVVAGITDLRAGVWNTSDVKLAETGNSSGTVTTATTGYTLSLTSPISLVAGDEVFIGLGMIGTTLNIMGKAGGNTAMQSLTPAMTRSASGWVTGVLPNLSAGTLQWMWVELIP